MSTATLEKPVDVDTEYYVRTACPSNRRAGLQFFLNDDARVIDDQVIDSPDFGEPQHNVIVTGHNTEFLAKRQSSRIQSSGGTFESEVFDSLEAAMQIPENLQPVTRTTLPTLGNRTGGQVGVGTCGMYVESAGSNCILKSHHSGNCRTK